MFTVGEILVGVAGSGYAIINDGTLIEVLEVYGEESIKGKVIAQKNAKFKNTINREYDLGVVCNKTGKTALEKATAEQIEEISPTIGASRKATASAGSSATASGDVKIYEFKGGLKISIYKDGRVESNWNENRDYGPETKSNRISALTEFANEIEMYREKDMNPSLREILAQKKYDAINKMFTKEKMEEATQRLKDFFKEFQFVPSKRFVNTVGIIAADDMEEAMNYVMATFKVADNAYVDAVIGKIKSPEFKLIMNQLSLTNSVYSGKVINNRLKIYFGEPGTGKTTKATEESEGRCIICNAEMSPNDLLQDFDFDGGDATFKKSILRQCIEEGKKICLDEINFFSRETFKFLQGITDGKSSFTFKGEEIKIKDGFEIIGTMNLVQEGATIGIPEPLVDRCSRIVEFIPSAKDLAEALE